LGTEFKVAAVLLAAVAVAPAARLTEPARRAFQEYTAEVEARLRRMGRPATDSRLLGGETVRVEAVHGGSWPVSGGLMHHWRAAALVPGAEPAEMLTLLRDYDHLDRYYAPEVVSSRALRVEGDAATILMRFRKQKVITVVLDAEFEVRSGLTGGRGSSVSRSTHLWEVDHPGSPKERREPEGNDDGFLWRLNSYWSFEETPGGLEIECEAVSLTRDVPTGLGWLVRPIIQELPRESLEFTLGATRKALIHRRGP
jgi:hypothetical protein